MGELMDHSLINPNQLRHYGIVVQDDPTSNRPLGITFTDTEFGLQLDHQETILYLETHPPTQQEFQLTSNQVG